MPNYKVAGHDVEFPHNVRCSAAVHGQLPQWIHGTTRCSRRPLDVARLGSLLWRTGLAGRCQQRPSTTAEVQDALRGTEERTLLKGAVLFAASDGFSFTQVDIVARLVRAMSSGICQVAQVRSHGRPQLTPCFCRLQFSN
jgi:hypothetical protein